MLVVRLNYLRRVRFSSVPLYHSLVHVSHMSFHVTCETNYVIHYFVMFYLHYVNSFHYLCNIKLNIMTINNNETNNTMKGSIIGHAKQYNNI